MSLNIDIEFNDDKNKWLVDLEGEIDIYTSPKLKKSLIEALEDKNSDMLIDFLKVDYVDSTGLGALISILKKVKESDNMVYVENVKPNIRKLFDITNLDKVFEIKE